MDDTDVVRSASLSRCDHASKPAHAPLHCVPQNGVQRICSWELTCGGTKVSAAVGSVVDYSGSAIVNAANEGCISGGGVDGAISQAGGDALHEARERLPILVGTARTRCLTGDAKITEGGELACQWAIHAVGPNYHSVGDEDEGDRLLYLAYRSAMREARRKRLPDVAFSLLSAGIFRGSRPLKHVLGIGALAVSACAYEGLREVFLVGFTAREKALLTEVLEELSADPTAATEALLAHAAPSVAEMHHRALAGIVDDLPIGFAMSWMAASATPTAAFD